MIVWERQQGSDCIFALQGLRNIRIIRAMLMLLLAPKTARFRLMSRDLLCVNSFSGVPIFGCSLTQIGSNGNGKFRQRRTEWWPWSSQIPSIVFPANPRAGPATAGGRPPFAKQVAAYKCHLKPFVMTCMAFRNYTANFSLPAFRSWLIMKFLWHWNPIVCRLYLILQIPVKLSSML